MIKSRAGELRAVLEEPRSNLLDYANLLAEVASVGGYVQQYQVDVDPNKLRYYSLPLSMVVGWPHPAIAGSMRRATARMGIRGRGCRP